MKRQIVMLILVAVFPATLLAQSSLRRDADPVNDAEAAPKTVAEKRVWLTDEAVKGVKNAQEANNVRQFIRKMQPDHVNALTNAVLAQRMPPQNPNLTQQQLLRRAQLELARAQAIRQQLEYLYWQQRRGGNRVGYAPVITWLPQGTSFGASAVVSPDRRHVRINANPFFSSVGPVYSYNLNTGRTRRIPQYGGGYPNYYQPGYGNGNYRRGNHGHNQPNYTQTPRMPLGYPQRPEPPLPSAQPKRVYHDGLRTRVGP